jgi:hypothetical protein
MRDPPAPELLDEAPPVLDVVPLAAPAALFSTTVLPQAATPAPIQSAIDNRRRVAEKCFMGSG